MTPGERNLMNAEIAAAVEAALAPVKEELAGLKRVDRRHSMAAGALVADIRKSKSEITEQVDDTVDALARRDQNLVAALNEVRAELVASRSAATTSIAPVATDARNAAIDLNLVKKDTARTLTWWRHPALPVFAYAAARVAYKLITGHDAPE